MGTPANIAATFEELPSVSTSTTNADASKAVTDTPAKVDFSADTKPADTKVDTGDKGTKFSDPDSSAALDALRDLGITKENARDYVEAHRTLQNVAYAMQHNPAGLLGELRDNNPKAFEKFIDVASDMYLERHPAPKEGETAGASKGSAGESVRTPNDPLMKEVAALKQELGEMKSRDQQRAAADRMSELKKEYITKVNKMLDRVPGLTVRERKALVALTSESLSEDSVAVGRVNQGDFRDVSKHLQRVYDSWAADTKTASSDEHAARERVAANGDRVITPSASQTGGEVAKDDKPAAGSRQNDAWEDTEKSFVAALQKTARK